ncbi:MAG: ATP-binding protein, partial [Ilumatobacteraceae bacterium]
MTSDELEQAVLALRTLDSEVTDVEAKSAVGGLPKSIRSAISAFANTDGGVILLGLDEATKFAAVGIPDPAKLAIDLSSMLADEFEPPVRALISQLEYDGRVIVVAEIPAVSYEQRPCYYKGAGMSAGSWTRTGASNR